MWTPWASEIAADVFAFLHTGYASVAALYDVVGDADDDPALAGRRPASDRLAAHGAGLRVVAPLLRRRGPVEWRCSAPWRRIIRSPPPTTTLQPLLARSRAAMPRIADACLSAPVPALGGRPMTDVLDPTRVSPERLPSSSAPRAPRSGPRRTGGAQKASASSRSPACARPKDPETAPVWIERARSWLTGRGSGRLKEEETRDGQQASNWTKGFAGV